MLNRAASESRAAAPGSRHQTIEAGMSATQAATTRFSDSFFSADLAAVDPEIARAIGLELGRQR